MSEKKREREREGEVTYLVGRLGGTRGAAAGWTRAAERMVTLRWRPDGMI